MPGLNVYAAERIFTGEAWLQDHAICVENGKIKDIAPISSATATQQVSLFDNCIIAPAFIDLQIYGAYGRLLAVYPEADSLFKLHEYCIKSGTAFCLPTVATNTKEVFFKSIDAVREYWNRGGKGVLGLHLEGPWINPVKRGAHIESFIHPPSMDEVKEVLNYGNGVIKMITLAPEVCSDEIINMIHSKGIIIAAGHTNATYDEAMKGFKTGVGTITHLYNAMSPLQHRGPGLVGAAFDHPTITASIIPDGYHVDYAAIRVAKKIMKERLFVITDAVTETNTGIYPHALAGDKYEAGGILSGSALTMNKALKNLVDHVAIDLDEALRMCSFYPARVMKMDQQLGKIKKGYEAALVVLDKELNVVDTVGL